MAATLGKNPRITNSIPAITATWRLATLVREIIPIFWLKEVLGQEPTSPPKALPTPSDNTPAATLLSPISILDVSPIAFKHPTVPIVATK